MMSGSPVDNDRTTSIEAWSENHPRWIELLSIVANERQADWVAFHAECHASSHMLVALHDAQIVGFLRFVVQAIGADDDHEPVQLDGMTLTEAKVLAFGVVEARRRQGWGRALQQVAIQHAKSLGCYQMRSHSSGTHESNHRLKLRMGFGVYPTVRGDDRRGVYFIMPLGSPSTK